jgi:hypothetical protein
VLAAYAGDFTLNNQQLKRSTLPETTPTGFQHIIT